MPVPQSEIVGFPRAWQPFYDVTVAAEAVYRANVLQEILAAFGVTIHSVISSEDVRQAVLAAWKSRKALRRHEEVEAVQLWEEYLQWVERQTGQVFADRTPPWVWRHRLVAAFI